jgi:peptide/nickel transport system ATP-binding protein/oligopeptide transport system ATP-binding protein
VSSTPLLELDGLRTHFFTEEGVVRAVDGVSLSIARGEVLGVVGESGSGKSVTILSAMRLVPDPPGRIVSGRILLAREGQAPEDLARASEARMRALRGDRLAMVFQDPMTSLNPYLRIGVQLAEVLEVHRGLRRREARDRSAEMLASVGIPDPGRRLDDHPHQLSGGMRQRVMIAMALLCEPELLFADEPTTALDVTIQAQILELLRARTEATGLAIVLVTHDLGVVARLADRVAVMYAGRIVELASASTLFDDPRHPYTVGLRRSVPRVDGGGARTRLVPIPGSPPSLVRLPPGCPFAPRCPSAIDVCSREEPPVREVSKGEGAHLVRCHVDDPDAVRAQQRPRVEASA